MQLAPVITRLKSEVTAFKKVAGAAEYGAVRKDLKPLPPVSFVIPLRDAAGRNELENAISQRVSTQFAIVLAVQNLRDPCGGQANEDLDPLRAAVMTALLGWPPDLNHDPCEYVGGQLLDLDGALVWWQDVFTTAFYARSV